MDDGFGIGGIIEHNNSLANAIEGKHRMLLEKDDRWGFDERRRECIYGYRIGV